MNLNNVLIAVKSAYGFGKKVQNHGIQGKILKNLDFYYQLTRQGQSSIDELSRKIDKLDSKADLITQKTDALIIRDLLAANLALDDIKAAGVLDSSELLQLKNMYRVNTGLPMDGTTCGISNSQIRVMSYFGLFQIGILENTDEKLLTRYILHMFATGEPVVSETLFPEFYNDVFQPSIVEKKIIQEDPILRNYDAIKILWGQECALSDNDFDDRYHCAKSDYIKRVAKNLLETVCIEEKRFSYKTPLERCEEKASLCNMSFEEWKHCKAGQETLSYLLEIDHWEKIGLKKLAFDLYWCLTAKQAFKYTYRYFEAPDLSVAMKETICRNAGIPYGMYEMMGERFIVNMFKYLLGADAKHRISEYIRFLKEKRIISEWTTTSEDEFRHIMIMCLAITEAMRIFAIEKVSGWNCCRLSNPEVAIRECLKVIEI